MSGALDEFLRRQEQAPQAAAQIRIDAARQQAPQQAADVARTSRGLGVPASTVQAAPDVYKQKVTDLQDGMAIGRSTPLAAWLSQNETNAPVARGSFEGLAAMRDNIDNFATRGMNPLQRIADISTRYGGLAAVENLAKGAYHYGADLYTSLRSGDVNASKIGSALASGVASTGTGIAGVGEAVARSVDKYSPIAMAERSLFGGSLEGMAADRAQSQGQKWDQTAKYLHPETKTEAGAGVISGFESLPMSVGSLLGGAYFRSAKLATAVMAGITGGQSYRSGIDAGLSHEAALAYGTADAAIEYGTEIGPEKALLSMVGHGTGGIKANIGKFLFSEVAGEQIATIGQDFDQWLAIDRNKGATFADYLAQRPAAARQTLTATLVMAGAVTGGVKAAQFAAEKMGRRLPDVMPAEDNARFLNALGKLSAASEVL